MTKRSGFSARTVAQLATVLALATSSVEAALCGGDCNSDGEVTVNELVTAVNIALETSPVEACAAVDANTDGAVAVNEVVAAVNNALAGCPPTDTPTPSPSATPTDPPPTFTATPAPTVGGAVPTSSAELRAWLDAGMYKTWTAESARHPSAGPHGATVRTFLNDLVLESLAAGNTSHPAGSALVKELYFDGNTVQLWAVEVKVKDDSDAGRGWYWWEGGLSGLGHPACTGCHSAGHDYVLTPFPLQ